LPGSLTSDGCSLVTVDDDGKLLCFLAGGLEYAPGTYVYRDTDGRVLTMASTGELLSIEDRGGNAVKFSRSGIVNGAGDRIVSFERDAQSRIITISAPDAAFGQSL